MTINKKWLLGVITAAIVIPSIGIFGDRVYAAWKYADDKEDYTNALVNLGNLAQEQKITNERYEQRWQQQTTENQRLYQENREFQEEQRNQWKVIYQKHAAD